MLIKKVCCAALMMAMPLAAHANNRSLTKGCANGGGASSQQQFSQHEEAQQAAVQHEEAQQTTATQLPAQQDCRLFNQSGTTCAQVGFAEGQYGAPWGQQSGFFVCVDRCLRWVGWNLQH